MHCKECALFSLCLCPEKECWCESSPERRHGTACKCSPVCSSFLVNSPLRNAHFSVHLVFTSKWAQNKYWSGLCMHRMHICLHLVGLHFSSQFICAQLNRATITKSALRNRCAEPHRTIVGRNKELLRDVWMCLVTKQKTSTKIFCSVQTESGKRSEWMKKKR